MKYLPFLLACFCAACSTGGFQKASPNLASPIPSGTVSRQTRSVRTTAYCHKEDGVKRNAIGSSLVSGKSYSAAADWSLFPVGTIFRLPINQRTYVIDDYGPALVGTETIDLYVPSMREMRNWGVRRVSIDIVHMGSYEKSLSILRPRAKRGYIRKMVHALEVKVR